MILLWAVLIMSIIVALLFLFYPLLMSVPPVNKEATQINKENSQSLNLSPDSLQFNLSKDALQSVPDLFNQQTTRDIKTVLLLTLIIPTIALTLYWHWGASQQLQQWFTENSENIAAEQLRTKLGTPQQMIVQLLQHLQDHPDSAEGWFLLGRLYASQQQFAEASRAFATANTLQPHTPEFLFNYAQALALENGGQFTAQSVSLLQEVLRLEPDNDDVRNLVAISAYQQKNYLVAIKNWEMMLPNYASNSSEEQALLAAIGKAELMLKKS